VGKDSKMFIEDLDYPERLVYNCLVWVKVVYYKKIKKYGPWYPESRLPSSMKRIKSRCINAEWKPRLAPCIC